MASRGSTQNRIIMLASLILLVVLTPFVVSFITNNQQTTENFAAPSTSSSISLSPTIASSNLSLGSWISFSTTYPKTVKNPRIVVNCYLDKAQTQLVFGMGGAVDYQFQLGGAGSLWLYNYPQSSTYCTAILFYFGFHAGQQTYNPLATTSFTALGRQ